MSRMIGLILIVAAVVTLAPERVQAQPSRQMPGTRPYLPGTPPINAAALNPRIQAAPSNTGVQSTDFYGKRGYPKVLGDSVETQSSGASASGTAAGISGGNAGVQSSGSAGFQGNTGNQIGQNGGGTILGGLFGGGGFRDPNGFNGGSSGSLTGGAFTGMAPKGFGFGGTPDSSNSWTSPLHGASGK
jgi:hypothetical protein